MSGQQVHSAFEQENRLIELLSSGFPLKEPDDQERWRSLSPKRRFAASREIVLRHPATTTPVEVVDYDPAWPQQARLMADTLSELFPDRRLRFEHVGSTSVVGLPAKPMLDLDLVIPDWELLQMVSQRLTHYGYIQRGPCGVPGRELFRCVIDLAPHHLYVCAVGSPCLDEHLRFRDALGASPELAIRYANLKKELARKHRSDRNAYTGAKSDFIRAVLARC